MNVGQLYTVTCWYYDASVRNVGAGVWKRDDFDDCAVYYELGIVYTVAGLK